MGKQHNDTTDEPNHFKLVHLVRKLVQDCELPDVLAPRGYRVPFHTQASATSNCWEINIKSVWTAEKVVELLQSKEDKHLRDLYGSLHKYPRDSTLVGRVFKAIVHHVLSGGPSRSLPSLSPPVPPPQGSPSLIPSYPWSLSFILLAGPPRHNEIRIGETDITMVSSTGLVVNELKRG